jgi:hypothetical protein
MSRGNRSQYDIRKQKDILETFLSKNWESRDSRGFYTKASRYLSDKLKDVSISDNPLSYPSVVSTLKDLIKEKSVTLPDNFNNLDGDKKLSHLLQNKENLIEKFETDYETKVLELQNLEIDFDKNLETITKLISETPNVTVKLDVSKMKTEIKEKINLKKSKILDELLIHNNSDIHEQYEALSEIELVKHLNSLHVKYQKCDETFTTKSGSYTPDIIAYDINDEKIYLDPTAEAWLKEKES